ncbi:hypothetical protein ACIBF1_17060 [Spirillospora sp. NPDC050679]
MTNCRRLASPKASVAFFIITIALSSCGGGKEDKKTSPTPPPSPSTTPTATPAPSFTAEHVRQSLITPKDIGPKVKQIPTVSDFLKDRQAPMCSLTGAKLPGSPKTAARQFTNSIQKKGGVNYLQLIAHYDEAPSASTAFATLTKKARSCPKKQHVAPKRIRKNFTLFAHDDTWRTSEGTLDGWSHLRGYEKHVEPPSQTKDNVYYFSYDYAVRGNVLVTTLYSERTGPKDSGDPSYKRSLDLLTKQLQKIG